MSSFGKRAVSTFPLSKNNIASLFNAGYTTASDVRLMKTNPARLASDINCSLEDALKILNVFQTSHTGNASSSNATNTHGNTSSTSSSSTSSSTNSSANSSSSSKVASTALDLLRTAKARTGIVTFSPEIDKKLFSGVGGVPMGQMTEFCGAPGLGKTQICMQLACNVTIPRAMGGVQGSCVYIDTEGSFMVDRVYQIAAALVKHLKKNVKVNDKVKDSDVPRIPDILSKIHCFRVHDYTEQLATLKILPEFISTHPDVKLIVLDSVAFHFRHDFTDMAKRSRVLSQMAQTLNKMSSDYNLSVVVTNHVTTKMNGNSSGNSGNSGNSGSSSSSNSGKNDSAAYLAPALGESWSHAATNRVELFWNSTIRTARLTKSPSLSLRNVPYQIVADGVRGITYKVSASTNKSGRRMEGDGMEGNCEGETASKKQRVL